MKYYLPIVLAAAFSVGCGDTPSTPPATPPAADTAPAAGGSGDKPAESADTPAEGSGSFNPEGLPTLAVYVPGIHCENCAAGVNGVLADMDGVKGIDICVDSKTATLAVDESVINRDAIIEALTTAEFTNSKFVEKDAEASADPS